ncbi:MAG: ATP-binding cassette domain-containing protein [Burkholderiales bacterium]|nr:ATP-binding cassette domain-containing protein [Burkholderiales bacterium]
MRFGGVEVLRGIDFSIVPGELRCLVGPNGAGKSTFFKCLTGQYEPSGGEIRFKNESIGGRPSVDIARRGIGIKTQVPSLYDGLTAREHIWLAVKRRIATTGGLRREVAPAVEQVLESMDIAHLADRIVGQLAHGQRQMVELSMVTAAQPDLILLDEPAAGMTHDEVERLAALVLRLRGTCSLIVVEHDMQFIRMIARMVTVLHQGQVLMEDDVETVLRDRRVRDVYLGKREV